MSASPGPDTRVRHVVWSAGEPHVFDSDSKARAFVLRKKTRRERQESLRAVEMLEELHRSILESTGGRGISEEDLEDALRAAKDH